MTYYCCHRSYMSLGDLVLHHKTKSRKDAQDWVRQRSYFDRVFFTEEAYKLAHAESAGHCDADPY